MISLVIAVRVPDLKKMHGFRDDQTHGDDGKNVK